MKDRNSFYKDIAILGIISLLFVLIFSFSTSPLYLHYWGSDSAQFQTIGMAWASGKIPYKDIFDHKGPFIFWINMLGYKLWGREGVCLFQVVFLFFTLLGLYKIIRMVSWDGHLLRWGALILCVLSLAYMYSGGNMCEEYCLPFLMFSAYGQFSFFSNDYKKSGHNIWWGLFYGITVSICILTRATNAIAVLCGIILIAVKIIYEKQYKNLLGNILFFIFGFTFIFVPFGIYFGAKGAFGDFLFGTIGYNIIYAVDMEAWITGGTIETWANYVILFFPVILCIPAFIMALCNQNKYCAGYYLIVGMLENYLFCTGALYQHYAIIAFPNVAMYMVEWERWLQNKKRSLRNFPRKTSLIIGFVWIVMLSIDMVDKVNNRLDKNNDVSVEYEKLMGMISDEEYESVVAYGGGSMKDFYLRYDIIPCYKYFVLQESQGKRSDFLMDQIISEFALCRAIYILTDDNVSIINKILQEHYEKYAKTDKYTLYKLNDK